MMDGWMGCFRWMVTWAGKIYDGDVCSEFVGKGSGFAPAHLRWCLEAGSSVFSCARLVVRYIHSFRLLPGSVRLQHSHASSCTDIFSFVHLLFPTSIRFRFLAF